MKILNVAIKNIGAIADVNIPLNQPLMLFYGDIKQGKTTILNAIRIAFGGPFPDDILKHGELEGVVKLTTDEGEIIREFYRAKDGTVSSRPLTVTRAGARVVKPVEWLKKFLNPFLLDGEYLANMTPQEREKYFVELFGTSTEALDKENSDCEAKARELRAKVKGYGALELTPVERVNVAELRAKLADIVAKNRTEQSQTDAFNAQNDAFNRGVTEQEEALTRASERVTAAQLALDKACSDTNRIREWIHANPKKLERAEPELLDSTDLTDQISDAGAQNVRAEIFEGNQAKLEARKTEETAIVQLEGRQRDINAERAARLENITNSCGIPGLKFLVGGSFSFEDTDAGMLSTSQLMKLSSLLSSLYPDGVGLDLIDRAESLGKSIFDYVERAKTGNKTILATIVGERPATAPTDVGVFVVEGGKII